MDIMTFSPAAILQIKKNVAESEHGNMALRFAAKMTGDEKVEYGIGFDEVKEDDTIINGDGFKVIISAECIELLNGAHVDFVEIEHEKHHFIFLNPNDPSYKSPKDEDAFK